MTTILLILGGSIFVLLGVVHALCTIIDIYRPRYFAPRDDSVRAAMQSTTVLFTRGRADMWNAWLGFNISHSLGLFLFGAAAIWLTQHGELVRPALVVLVIGTVVYLAISLRFWFYAPSVSLAIALACFAGALLTY